jgi:predicted GNAT family acetyltransferase
MADEDSTVLHDVERRRFTISIDGDRSGFLDYRPIGTAVWDLTYTFVPRQDRGSGDRPQPRAARARPGA